MGQGSSLPVKGIPLNQEQLKAYMAVNWYEILVAKDIDFERRCKGAIACYHHWNEETKQFEITNYCIFERPDGKNLQWTCRKGVAERLTLDTADFLVHFFNIPEIAINAIRKQGGNYHVIDANITDTDEDFYAVVSSGSDRYFWILSNNPKFSKTQKFTELKTKYNIENLKHEERCPAFYEQMRKQTDDVTSYAQCEDPQYRERVEH